MLRWDLIGASTIAREHMVAALRSTPGADIGCIVSGDLARAVAFADACGIARATDDLHSLLSDPDINAVYISSTNNHHSAQAMAAIAAGKHVLFEKPLAMAVADAARMVRAAEQAGVVFATNHHLRCAGSHRAIRDLIRTGRIGQVRSLRVHHAVHLPAHLQGWRINDLAAGGGVIADITAHDADTVRFVLGDDPVAVVAQAGDFGMGSGVEDSVMSVWTMRLGAMVMAHESFTHRFAGTGIEVHGTEGSIIASGVMTQAPVGEVVLVTGAGRDSIRYAAHDLDRQAALDFSTAVAGHGRPAADGWDGVKSLTIALAVKEAARTGTCVPVRYDGP